MDEHSTSDHGKLGCEQRGYVRGPWPTDMDGPLEDLYETPEPLPNGATSNGSGTQPAVQVLLVVESTGDAGGKQFRMTSLGWISDRMSGWFLTIDRHRCKGGFPRNCFDICV